MAYTTPATAADGTNQIDDFNNHQAVLAELQAKVPQSLTGILKSTGTGAIAPAVADTDYLVPATAASTYVPLARTVAGHALSGNVTVSKGDVGLGNADNTADTAKPVSTAQQSALDLKAPLADPTFSGTVGGITKAMVGLGNVDNTADTAKPVSTAQQAALDLKAPLAGPTFTGVLTAAALVVTAAAPASQTAAGALDEIRSDASYFYRCTTAGGDGAAHWKRVALDDTSF